MRCNLPAAILVAAAIPAAIPVAARQAPDAVTVTIDAGKPGPVINRDIFGQFAEHLGTGIYGGVWVGPKSPIPNVRGIRKDVVAALRDLRVPNIRWPGGCFADEYHWRKGIGPADKRPSTLNASWGGVIEPNSFGTHEFMDFAEQVGAEVFVSVNMGSGSVEEAADWMEYMTADKPTALARERAANGHPAPWKVKYVGLGNENWGCGGAMSADHYVEEMKRFAHYTRNLNPAQAEGASRMQRIAVGWDGDSADYTEAVMQAWKSKVWSWDIEGVSLHSYTVGGWPPSMASTGFGDPEYLKLVSETLNMDGKITKQSAIMDRHDPEKKLSIVVDEWGAWLAPTPGSNPGFLQQQNSQRDAVIAALNLNIFIRHADRVRMTNIAQMANVLQAMVLTDGPRMVLTPTYHVYRLYVPFQDATRVPVRFDAGGYAAGGFSVPRIDAVAARDRSGKLWLAVTNLDPRRPATLTLAGAKSADGEVLASTRVDAHNSFDAPATVAPKRLAAIATPAGLQVELPPASIAVLGLVGQ
ncbi:alpha-N-arabinofuranosidase [Polymorphobacter fuscus]|uniref:non-reducing end alpha-L-arabinofuranosidase n=1 Tax=Sandarakinorhabdus fusca TaxID=1439888 RepID=A0A7C9LEP6_9SPHN|nr:alpha-L-arabinofuranosidase C-terminal domain-containing protein [Polymorphobacter fuscus]KAB7648561.1 alpha-N-arabinofuranosidase [Polymorphobacter fuscus]MQT16107.1 alpha-N-arabinofuranosidase [Polymorphobacter fuscus]NJC07614.1 alpha-N-arabinofuranosidase [Polymorphobacter fuscus]